MLRKLRRTAHVGETERKGESRESPAEGRHGLAEPAWTSCYSAFQHRRHRPGVYEKWQKQQMIPRKHRGGRAAQVNSRSQRGLDSDPGQGVPGGVSVDTWSVLTPKAGQQLCSSGLITTPGEGSLRGGGHTAASVRLVPRQWPGGSASLPGSQLPPRPCAPEHQRRTKPPGEAGSPPPWAGGGRRRPVFSLGYRAAGGRGGPELLHAPLVRPRDCCGQLSSRPSPRQRRRGLPRFSPGETLGSSAIPSEELLSLLPFADGLFLSKAPHKTQAAGVDRGALLGGAGPVREQCLRTVGSMRRSERRVGGNSAVPHRTLSTGILLFGVTAGP